MKTENKIYMNRELSWLKFNERVLDEAKREGVPLCERLTFLSIYQTNLEEFFRVRVGSLQDQNLICPNDKENKTNMTPAEQINAILSRVRELNSRKDAIYDELQNRIAGYGIRFVSFKELGKDEESALKKYFNKEVLPLLSIMIVARKQPFPFLRGQEIYAVASLDKKNGKERIGIIPCNIDMVPRMIGIKGKKNTYILREELILHYMPMVFKGYKIIEKSVMKVTRNADIDVVKVYDEDLDYRDHMAKLIKLRKKLAPVLIELTRDIDDVMVNQLCDYLELGKENVIFSKSPLDFSYVFDIQDILRDRQELFFEKRVPKEPACVDENRPMIPQILEKDMLLSYPYESIKPFLRLLHEAANDKNDIIQTCQKLKDC